MSDVSGPGAEGYNSESGTPVAHTVVHILVHECVRQIFLPGHPEKKVLTKQILDVDSAENLRICFHHGNVSFAYFDSLCML
jgi:hypothetical protein